VIVLSADATARQINRLTRAGASHYLTKPLDLDLLVSTVRDVLSG
jgi:DNA-binding NarL/FixJ family response regulator